MRLIDADELIEFLEEEQDGAVRWLESTYKYGIEKDYDKAEISERVISNLKDSIMDMIKEQPTVNEWIPCSERLPLREGELISDEVLVCLESGYQRVATYHKKSEEWHDCYDTWINEKVVAWMPLPEPYKEIDE